MDVFHIEAPEDRAVCSIGWDWDTAKRIGLGYVTGGGSEFYKHFYTDPANQQKTAYDNAGKDAAALGNEQRNYETGQGNKALGYYSDAAAPTTPRPMQSKAPPLMPQSTWDEITLKQQKAWDDQQLAAVKSMTGQSPISPDRALMNLTNNRPTQQQDYFQYMKDQAGGATNQEELYNLRKTGADPAAAYEDQRGTEQINKQLAARGRFNSGPGVRQISDYLANANAQRSHDLALLAGGADSSRNALSTTYGGAAKGASGEQSDYFGNVMDASQSLARDKADIFSHYSDRGSDAYAEGRKARSEAELARAGVDAATANTVKNDLGSAFKFAWKMKTGQG